jgi:hypothetical protein
MNRILLPWLLVSMLAAAAVVSVRHALADETAAGVNQALYEAHKTFAATGTTLVDAAWKNLQSEAETATRLAPHNGYCWHALARVYAQPRMNGAVPVSPDDAAAFAATTRAVVAQPSSGYAWSSMVAAADRLFAQNQLAGGKAALEQAIGRTTLLAAREPQALATVVDLGLANWPVLEVAAKADVLAAVKQLAQRHAEVVLAIADRRGGMPVVCEEPRLSMHRLCRELASVDVPRNTAT